MVVFARTLSALVPFQPPQALGLPRVAGLDHEGALELPPTHLCDGDLDSVLQLRSNQGAGGGAHNLDLLGTITVLDNTSNFAGVPVTLTVTARMRSQFRSSRAIPKRASLSCRGGTSRTQA